MRIVAISDTHGSISRLEDVIVQQPYADYFIHLGDGEWDVTEVRYEFPERAFLVVAGNCDFGSQLPTEDELLVSGKRIFFTHGHRYRVKSDTSMIIDEAFKREADILLFGHTHEAYVAYERGLYIMNPGSLGHPRDAKPSYGVIDITKAGIVTHIVEL